MRILNIVYILLILNGCSFQNTTISNVRVIEKGADPGGAFCNKFSLTNAQAFELINSSREVEINEYHNNYEYLPCFVKGRLNMGTNECNFTIRAGGTVELNCDDNTGFLYVCDLCDHLLRDNE